MVSFDCGIMSHMLWQLFPHSISASLIMITIKVNDFDVVNYAISKAFNLESVLVH